MIPFRRFITEGGWANAITQGVKLTPDVVKKTAALLPRFQKDFNAYLASIDMEEVKIGKMVGSGAYHEHDLKHQPNKEYGDIDVIFSLPRIEGYKEAQITSLYRQTFLDFLAAKKPKYAYLGKEQTGQNIILNVDGKWVQADLVATFHDTEDWATHRMTPEHNMKGAFMGFLYSALSEVLHLSIGSSGVQVKHIGNEIVPFAKQKVDKVATISTNIETFALDILKYLHPNPKVAPLLRQHPGLNKEEIKFSDLANAVKGLGQSFELNHMYGKGPLKSVKSYDDFIAQIKRGYVARAEKSAAGSKFDKAATPDAIRRAADMKHQLKVKTAELLKQL